MNNALVKFLTIFLILCTFTVKLSAQTTGKGKISGKVVDATNNQPIPYASAIIYDKKTLAKVRAAQTDLDGNFVLTDLPNGVFTFKASYIGFQTMVRDSIKITDNTAPVNLGTVNMKASKGNAITEVTITAAKATMQMGIDKKVFSVDQSLVSEGGSASDLLQNVPSVQTDIDGNVSLRGSNGVKVLIDGKPSLIAGGNIAQILQSIPASSIETVELITNPSAKYDAEGQSGIINIVLKRNKKLGFNGSVALTAGNRDNYNGNTNLSFQNSRINLFGNYGYRYGNRPGGGYNDITYKFATPTETKLNNQESESASLDKSHNFKAGLDYYLTDKDVLSFSGGFNIRDNDRTEAFNINQYYSLMTPKELSYRNNFNYGSGKSYDLNLDFVHKFTKPKEELTFNLGWSEGNNLNNQTYETNIYNVNGSATSDIDLQQNNNNSINRNINIQADYSLPVGKAGKIEAGLRSQIKKSESGTYATIFNTNTQQYDVDFALTNEFNNTDQVHAAYLNYQNSINNFGYQVGLRAEDASLDTKLGTYDPAVNLTYTPGRIAYTRLYPSVFLTQKFEGDNQIQASYSRRVNRPRGWDTNPFLDVSDRFNYRQGNPNLKPEDVHAFELSYSKYFKKGSFTSSVYMRQTNDVIQRVRTEPVDGITITTPENLTRSTASGLELISRIDVSKKWNFTTNVNLYQSKLTGVPALKIVENSGFSWNANLTTNITLPYNISLQLKGDYRAAEIMAQGKRNAMYGFDGGAKYDFPSKKASLSLNVRDIFNTRAWSMTTSGELTDVDFRRYQQGTMANLTFSYRFGKSTFDLKKSKKQDQQEGSSGEESF